MINGLPACQSSDNTKQKSVTPMFPVNTLKINRWENCLSPKEHRIGFSTKTSNQASQNIEKVHLTLLNCIGSSEIKVHEYSNSKSLNKNTNARHFFLFDQL